MVHIGHCVLRPFDRSSVHISAVSFISVVTQVRRCDCLLGASSLFYYFLKKLPCSLQRDICDYLYGWQKSQNSLWDLAGWKCRCSCTAHLQRPKGTAVRKVLLLADVLDSGVNAFWLAWKSKLERFPRLSACRRWATGKNHEFSDTLVCASDPIKQPPFCR